MLREARREKLNFSSQLNVLLIEIVAEETLKPVDVRLWSNRHRICSTRVLSSTRAFYWDTRELTRLMDVFDHGLVVVVNTKFSPFYPFWAPLPGSISCGVVTK